MIILVLLLEDCFEYFYVPVLGDIVMGDHRHAEMDLSLGIGYVWGDLIVMVMVLVFQLGNRMLFWQIGQLLPI